MEGFFMSKTLMETEYPKVLDSRKASTMMSTWTEYLRLRKEDEGTAVLEISGSRQRRAA